MVSGSITGAGLGFGPRESVETGHSPWIVSPIADYFFVCGGLLWLVLIVNYAFIGTNLPTNQYFILALLVGQNFSDTHVGATWDRIISTTENRSKFKFFRTILPLMLLPVFLYGILVPHASCNLLYIYILASFWHWGSQSFGVSLIYCYKRNYKLKSFEREIYRAYFYSVIIFCLTRMLTYKEYSPSKLLWNVKVPFWGPLPDWICSLSLAVSLSLTVVVACMIGRKALTEKRLPPLPAMFLVATTFFTGLCSEGTFFLLMVLYALPFFHATQYIAVTLGYKLKQQKLSENATQSAEPCLFEKKPTLLYLGRIAAIGAIFYYAIPMTLCLCGFKYYIVGLTTLSVFGLHHFLTDAAIWRLRDPKCREILLA